MATNGGQFEQGERRTGERQSTVGVVESGRRSSAAPLVHVALAISVAERRQRRDDQSANRAATEAGGLRRAVGAI